MKWWNNGVKSVRSLICPEGFVAGRMPFKCGSPSSETRKKQSDSHKGKIPWNKGIKTGPEPEHVKMKKKASALVRDNSIYLGRQSWMKGLNRDDSRVDRIFEKQSGRRRIGNFERGIRHHNYNPQRRDYLRYRQAVHLLTEKNYVKHQEQINPMKFPRSLAGVEGGYHLDHIKSVKQCWKESISIEEAASVSNLQMLSWLDNVKKGAK